jgi:hypothetical protein
MPATVFDGGPVISQIALERNPTTGRRIDRRTVDCLVGQHELTTFLDQCIERVEGVLPMNYVLRPIFGRRKSWCLAARTLVFCL